MTASSSIAPEVAADGHGDDDEEEEENNEEDEDNRGRCLSWTEADDIRLMYYDTQALRASTVEKTADVQLRLSREKLEAAQTRERTSIAKMYTDLLMADLSGMTDMQRAEHQRALQYFGDKVYEHSKV
ncbi:glutathione S-transferase T2-like [Panicum miliaceum]|uniref:Glutathione S-transferase T2-like n=1 Tax=Panicum miliaceum TaxID=4540 RepID=A0A3L6QAI4_PANMI|nr:glutathione S-transferase T2-like [Panicum miliaceum]